MADRTQLDILTRGVTVWNDWRRRHKTDNVDLSGIDLRELVGDNISLAGSNLEKSNLNGANLFRADLSDTNLSHATLIGTHLLEATLCRANIYSASLRNANLSKSNLVRANLRKADLSYADLSFANLNQANLLSANFTEAHVKNSDFKEAVVGYTNFGNINLGTALNLDAIHHKYASIIDPMTLVKSGQLPPVFLRGCGLTDAYIEQMPTILLSSGGASYYRCFISYSHHDKDFARRLHDTLQANGIRCWLDDKDMIIGQDLHEAIRGGILESDKVLLCCSKSSLTSSWVDNEIIIALRKEQESFHEHGRKRLVLIPLNLDNFLFDMEWQSGKKDQLQSRLAANFVNWRRNPKIFRQGVDKLVSALQRDSQVGPP